MSGEELEQGLRLHEFDCSQGEKESSRARTDKYRKSKHPNSLSRQQGEFLDSLRITKRWPITAGAGSIQAPQENKRLTRQRLIQ